MRDQAELYKALADETRLKMLVLLGSHGELCVCDFEGALALSQSAASRHLRRLYREGLVDHRRTGPWVYYRLHDDLSDDRRALVESLERVIPARERAALEESLSLWLVRKATEGVCS